MTVIPFFRNAVIELRPIWIISTTNDVTDGYQILLRRPPHFGAEHYWEGLTLNEGLAEAQALLAIMPGATLEILEDLDDDDDDPDGGVPLPDWLVA